jgi:signal transduction histidine kinase
MTADADRRAIERALHDGVLQDLVGLAANLEVVAGSLEVDPRAARTILDELQRETRRALTELRELAQWIFPPLLEAGGLVAELRAAAGREGVQARIEVDADVFETAPPEAAGAVYFCALDTFERASGGSLVIVSVRGEAGALSFEIAAEGDLGSERRAAHDRVDALGGRVTITAEGDRTTVAGALPIPR